MAELSKESEQRIRAFCLKATGGGLSADVLRELENHYYDKVAAYLSGEQKLSEEDALLLVESHFGDPSTVQALLGEVHEVPLESHWLRRLAAIVLVTMCVQAPLQSLAYNLSMDIGGQRSSAAIMNRFAINMVVSVIVPAILVYLPFRWHRQIRQGRRPWFTRWYGSALGVAVLSATILWIFAMRYPMTVPIKEGGTGFQSPMEMILLSIQSVFSLLLWVVQGWVWVWWSDLAGQRRSAVIVSSLAWSMVMLLPFIIALVANDVPFSALAITEPFTAWAIIGAFYFITYDIARAVSRARRPTAGVVK